MFQITGYGAYEESSRHAVKPILMLTLLCSTNVLAQAECVQPTLVAPAKELIADARPRIEWTPVPGAKFYKVWVESRVPEGRVLFTQDVQTTASFWQPPQPLTDYRANVRIRVQANCGNASVDPDKLKLLDTRFRVDTGIACTMPELPAIKLTPQGVELSWRVLPEARLYEISAFPAQGAGNVVVKSETTRASMRLERPANGIWTVGVRPRCANGYGAYRFQTLNVN